MVKENLVKYIRTKLDEKYSHDGIKLALRRLGYSAKEINEAFDVVTAQPKPIPRELPPVYKEAPPRKPIKLVKPPRGIRKVVHSEEEHQYARKAVTQNFISSIEKNKKVVALLGIAIIVIFVALFALDQLGGEAAPSGGIGTSECTGFSSFIYQGHSLEAEGDFEITLKSSFSNDITVSELSIDNLKFNAFEPTEIVPDQVVTLKGASSVIGTTGSRYVKSVKVGYTTAGGVRYEEATCSGRYQ